ncbi:MAG: HAMP domain-containing protein [Planctomycetes bacterium]|nr:HAMP domain-containing protein [Planctomycetota bacterium]
MKSLMTLRQRILLTLLPLLILLGVLGSAGLLLLHRLGGAIDVILRENYESVIAMQDLKEALERIDSSFQFMLVARGLSDVKEKATLEAKARTAFEEHWRNYESALRKEQQNITIHPAEDELVERLLTFTARYRIQGTEFYARAAKGAAAHQDYYGSGGLYDTFGSIKQAAHDVLQLNQKQMKTASVEASQTAVHFMIGLGAGLAAAVLLAGLSAWHTIRTTLRPIREVTRSAQGISAGNLDQVVPVLSGDELGELAQAFNLMARHLREFRQSHGAQLLRAQRTSQATIDSFPDPVLVIDSEGSVELANPAARRLLGVVPKQPGQPATGIWQPPEPLCKPLAEALQGRSDYLPEGFDRALLLGSSGRERALLPRILAIRDPLGYSLGVAVLLQDVTRLRLLDQVKGNMVATVSHELKTPLTSIRLAVHLLLEESVGPLTPKQMELLLDARENSERLLAMVNNLLDLARLEQGSRQLDVRPETPVFLLQSAADAICARAEDKNVQIKVEAPDDLPPISVDVKRIGHALSNLLDNALTYTDSGGTITLTASPDGDGVMLSVTDTGCGIPSEYVGHVFEKFFRVPGQSRGSGTGLGLAIVQEIVTAHGGIITCESQPGAGTVFRMRLPIAAKLSESPDYVVGHALER